MSKQIEQLMVQGVSAMEAKAFKEAIQHFSQVIVLDAQFFEAYYRRGHCWVALHQFEQAKKDFMQTMRLNPQYPEAAFYLGHLLEADGEICLCVGEGAVVL